jgi:opacity protein-like surface antigen
MLRHVALGAAAGVALAITATSASADGYAPGAKVYRPYDWSGFYVGGQIGWKNNDFDWAFNPAIPAAVNQAFSLNNDSAVGGFHGGLQYQWGQIVVGAEVAWNRDLRSDWASHVGYGVGAGGNAEARSNDLVTVGGKLGWTPMSHWLVYASGGWATAEIQTRDFVRATGAVILPTHERHDGGYVGGGLDYALSKHIIIGLNYQHVFLETINHCPNQVCIAGDTNRHDMSLDSDIVQARLTLKFGREERVAPLK